MIHNHCINLSELIEEFCNDKESFSLISRNIKGFISEFQELKNRKTPTWILLYGVFYSFVSEVNRNGDRIIINGRDAKAYLDIHLEGLINDLIKAEKSGKYDDESIFDVALRTVEDFCDLYSTLSCYELCAQYASKI